MKVVVKNFFPRKNEKNKSFLGTMVVTIEEMGITIRGIRAFKKSKGFLVFPPAGYDDKDKKRYPIFNIDDQEKSLLFFKELQNSAKEFFEINLKENTEDVCAYN